MDWSRLFAETGFRWQMGLRTGDAQAFFAPTAQSGEILAERAQLLDEAPAEYSGLAAEGETCLEEMRSFAETLGVRVEPGGSIQSLGRALEPDFVLLRNGAEGPVIVGGVVCFPSSWSLREKMGRTLDETHGPVPGLNAQLAPRVRAALARLAPGNAWERENWGMARDGDRNHHPLRPRKRLDASVEPGELWLRVERQILYCLPRTGALLFGIRLEITPWAEFARLREGMDGLRRSLQSMPDDIAAYKGLLSARPKILKLLEG